MSLEAAVKLEGGSETIRALRDLDPKLRRETRKNIRNAAKPLQSAAKALVPAETPMSGWTSGRYAFTGAAKAGVKTSISTRGRKSRTTWPLVTLKQTNAGGAVFDMAGRRSNGKTAQGRQFIANLRNRHGRASRSMWRAAEAELPNIRKNVEQAVEKAARLTNTELRRRF